MTLLDESSTLHNDEAHKADEKAENIHPSLQLPTFNIEDTENASYIFSPSTNSSSTPILTPTSASNPIDVDYPSKPAIGQTPQGTNARLISLYDHASSSPRSIMADPTLSSSLESLADLDMSTPAVSSPLQGAPDSSLSTPPLFPSVDVHDAEGDTLMTNGVGTAAKISSIPSTALATRTTEDVIAELKKPNRVARSVEIANETPIVLNPLPALSSTSSVNGHSDADDEELGEDNDSEIDDDEDEADQPIVKTRKISERKRRQNAIAESYLQDTLRDPARKHKVLPEEEDKQSTRWMVHQAESRQIISSPREYQIELFERAKERNIIAVLDTGKFQFLEKGVIINPSQVLERP